MSMHHPSPDTAHKGTRAVPRLAFGTKLFAGVVTGALLVWSPLAAAAPQAGTGHAQAALTATPGQPYAADAVAALVPPSVYFQGKTAPLQVRNTAAVTLAGGQIVWAGLVDNSGYSSAVQERYQFYLVSEGPLHFGNTQLPAGAYGAGFLGDHYLVMDLGGHTLAQGPLENDPALHRPRPLQMVSSSPNAVRLYLGRHWVAVGAGTMTQGQPK